MLNDASDYHYEPKPGLCSFFSAFSSTFINSPIAIVGGLDDGALILAIDGDSRELHLVCILTPPYLLESSFLDRIFAVVDPALGILVLHLQFLGY